MSYTILLSFSFGVANYSAGLGLKTSFLGMGSYSKRRNSECFTFLQEVFDGVLTVVCCLLAMMFLFSLHEDRARDARDLLDFMANGSLQSIIAAHIGLNYTILISTMEPEKAAQKIQQPTQSHVQKAQEGTNEAAGKQRFELKPGEVQKEGESKSQFMARIKKERKEAEKLEKKKNEPEKHEHEKEVDYEKLDPTAYFENRSKAITAMKELKKPYPYPHKFNVQLSIREFVNKYNDLVKEANTSLEEVVSTAGRVINIRKSGKILFYDLIGDGEKLQALCKADAHKGEYSFNDTHKLIKRGDIVGFTGHPGRSVSGELSIIPGEIVLLSPCLHMIPRMLVKSVKGEIEEVAVHTQGMFGLTNNQTRYRKRFLDLIINNKTRETFITRTKVIKFVRNYLDKLGFLEVETPMMNMIPGGANARPFVTHHNDLDMKLYMRIAPQLYLKQLVIGGLDRVYEIGKNFRNEGIDQTHNPEYTSCEFYMAYADFIDLMALTEDMLSSMVKDITGGYIIKYHPEGPEHPDKAYEIDFTPPWKRINMMDELSKCLGQTVPTDLLNEEARKFFDAQALKHKVVCKAPRNTSRLIDKLVGHFIETQCKNPTFIIEHPQLMSPLAKYHREKPGLTERFELFINYHELCNAYTELNDPFTQKQLFLQQVDQKTGGDDESMFYDEMFVTALQHGLPPTAGWGLGIDRMVMLLTDNIRIQEVLLFPAMKPEEKKLEKVEIVEKVEKVEKVGDQPQQPVELQQPTVVPGQQITRQLKLD